MHIVKFVECVKTVNDKRLRYLEVYYNFQLGISDEEIEKVNIFCNNGLEIIFTCYSRIVRARFDALDIGQKCLYSSIAFYNKGTLITKCVSKDNFGIREKYEEIVIKYIKEFNYD